MTEKLLITNCRLFNAPQQSTSILIEDGVIAGIGQTNVTLPNVDTLDARGRIIAPGLIDIHIQGAGGADVLDATPDALKAISQTCARFGVTGFLATTVFKQNQKNEHLLLAARYVGRDLGGANRNSSGRPIYFTGKKRNDSAQLLIRSIATAFR
jgi:N-acetylglucosamine-6-phosphate deacetylase